MNRESTRLGQDGGSETRANLILRLEKTKLEMESLRAAEREIKRQIQVEDMEEGECSSQEEEILPEYPSEQKYVESTSFRELSTMLTEQSKSMAQAMSRQTGLKDLPKFSGDPDEWRIFLAQYRRSTSICGYDSTENVARLEKSLTGEARDAVKALLTSPASADEIIQVLSRRFGNTRQMLLRLIDQAKNIDGPKDDNPLSVAKFATAVHNIAVSLEQLDGGRYLTSVSVVDDLERKLTPIMRMLWSEAVYKRTNYTVKELSLWLQQRAEAALSIAPINTTKSTRSNTIALKERKKSSVRSVLSVVSQGEENTKRGCANCQEDHYTTVCPKLRELTPEGRFVRVRELKLCLSCLGRNHRIVNCFRRRPCGIEGCKRQHHRLLHQKVEKPEEKKVEASLTNLGWIISGSTGETCKRKRSVDVVGHACQELIELIKQHYQFEDIKMKTENSFSLNKDEKKALEILESVTRLVGKRFETGLLWKTPKPEMPDSRSAAWLRLQQVEAKMDKDPKFRDQYSAKIQDYLSKGYLVPLDEHEKGMPKENVWYLPHFGVTNPNKPGKIRLVLDAAAEVNSISLNNSLLSGPNLTISLTGLLMRFRIGQHGFVGDIKEMFHQVRILPEDQNYQRILWRGNSRDTFPVEYKMTVMIFGATCSPAVASYVKNKNAEEYAEEFPEATREIVENHYVDDYLGSADDETSAIKLIKDVVHVHKMGGFQIRNFVSSSPVIINGLPPDLRLPKLSVDLDFDSKFEKVLGVWWEPLTDVFSFRNRESVDTENLPTKRQALKTLMKQLPAELCQQWKAWVAQLIHLSDVEIPRCYAPLEYRQGRVELHIFTDASEDAYAAVAYFRFVNCIKIHVSLVTAKAKVAPLKSASIPRLELEGAVLGCRLMQVIQDETKIEIDRKVFWTDSVVVLNWIRADSRSYKPFVGNRVGEIQEVTNPDEWKWVPTDLNVADIATRDTGNTDFSPESTWYSGPEFLYKSESEWPQQRESSEFVAATIKHSWEPVIDSKNYMRWSHIHRVMTYVYRFQRACREKWRTNGHSQLGSSVILSATDWEGGLRYLLLHSQRESFGMSMSSESRTGELQLLNVPRGSPLYKFNPAIDSCGIMRASGRLNNMPLVREDFKNPILLHADNRIVQLLLEDFHVRLGHWRADFVLAELRQRYEIIKGRATLKRLQRGCKTCQVSKAKPQIPLMGQLPSERLSMHVVPFTNTGCDMFGPLYVKSGRSEVKRYGMIFTCMTTRAIHLELCCSLSTDSCLLALRRFFGRRANPAKIISDNGTNFRGAARELKEAAASLDHAKVKAKLAKMNIEWDFNPPYSPHMGGCWERLIGPVKRALKQSVEITKHPPTEEVLHTLLVEAEHLVNSRPLLELTDSGEVMTPNHFLIHRQSGLTPGRIFEDQDLILRKEWRKSQRLADHFWQIWRKHYAPTLTHRPKWRESGQPIIEGDRVVVMEPNTKRNQWIFGRVIKAIPAMDGHARTATIRLEDGSECVRPVTRLAVIRPPPVVMDDDGIGE
ncbi:uncharacterized protein LOC129808566 [Phlebotomus papatasi]|uniref:uncharacterized protein LOC129808566 n=1 Tax=Phlebotomus papatasi TaxID=29031 RepID=UPI002484288E|nr:uncharacterized protein LOC129808566 [Phlebotomus papatasi]